MITEVVNPAAINAILKGTVQQLQVKILGLVVLKDHLINYLERDFEVGVRELVSLGPALRNVVAALLDQGVEIGQEED